MRDWKQRHDRKVQKKLILKNENIKMEDKEIMNKIDKMEKKEMMNRKAIGHKQRKERNNNMKNTRLNRQNHKTPDFKALHDMRDYLENLLDRKIETDESGWNNAIEEIIAFQYEDGSFNLLDSYRIESDCRVVYCHEPTYICTAILMKALLADENALEGREMEILPAAMHMCCARRLQGHGYDGLSGLIHAVDYFIKSDVKSFLKKYPDMCPEFTEMFRQIEEYFADCVEKEAFCGSWGEDYEQPIRAIHAYFYNTIFVYGTLMDGQPNHEDLLEDSRKIADGWIDGYEMYNLGS